MERLTWGHEYLMVAPHHYRVAYVINPYMDLANPVDAGLAWEQWHGLQSAIEQADGVVRTLATMPEDCPDMVYAMNLGYAMKDDEQHVLISRMRYPERQGESEVAREWFTRSGYRVHDIAMGPEYHLEAGDVFPWRGQLMVGTGPRTHEAALRFLTEAAQQPAFTLPSVSAHAYHLDLSFCPLTPEAALVWPGAFEPSRAQALLDLIPHPVILEDAEALADFSANSIVVKDTVIMPARTSSRLRRHIEELGLATVIVDVSEFEKGGGSVRCMTNPLDMPRGPFHS